VIRISNVKMGLDEQPIDAVVKHLKCSKAEIGQIITIKKSVDAREKDDVRFVCTFDVDTKRSFKNAVPAPARERWTVVPDEKTPEHPPVVVGLGPCGLFAALTLAKRGLKPIVLERGKDVVSRARDVDSFFRGGAFTPHSNVQFGEGGAGAFSDGKLTTGIKDVRLRYVLETLAEFGAPEEILWEAKPHVGTDRLPKAVAGIRNEIIRLGGEVRFETQLTGIITEAGAVRAAVTDKGTIETNAIVLAIGHSARDTFEMLNALAIPMERKPFSIGARIEHRQSWLNTAQYGRFATHPALGAADYKLNTVAPDGRGVYTFCMCPGGTVIAATGESDMVVTNGMSRYRRDGENCNSALLVDVHTDDFPESDGVLAGMKFQREWEHAAFMLGEGTYKAPAQLSGDFVAGVKSTGAGGVNPSYLPGVVWSDLSKCLPRFAVDGMRFAIRDFDRRIRGFAQRDAVLTGVETRSSSPVRIIRDRETFESALKGLYPCGEGAGYAGGISSAAVDGIKTAEKVRA